MDNLSRQDIDEIYAHFDVEQKRLESDTRSQAAWIAHYFPYYEYDYVCNDMPDALFRRLWAASQVIRIQGQLDIAVACGASTSKEAGKLLKRNAGMLDMYKRAI